MSPFLFFKGKSLKSPNQRPPTKWTTSILRLEPLENRALPSTLSFTATNMDFTAFTNEALAPTIPQFDTLGGARTLTSVEIISNVQLDSSVSGSVTNNGGTTATFQASVTNASVSVTGTGFTSPLSGTAASLLDTGPISCPTGQTTTIGPFAASVTASSDFTLTSPSDLAAFIGTGNLSYTNSGDATVTDQITGGSNIQNNAEVITTAEATVEVIYTFVSNPTLVTTASSAVTLGTTAPTLTDSAVLSGGGDTPGGTITFTLSGPGGFSFTQTDTVNGNGTYTAGDTLPTSGLVAGTYTWSAHYSGDTNNSSADDQGGTAEQTVVSPASPSVVTTASPGSVTLGTTGATLSDSALLSGGFFETGTITFTLSGPGGFTFTQTDTVNGNGTYTASDALTAGAAAGTYTWSAVYSGDGNNLTAPDQGGTAEQTAVNVAPGQEVGTIGFWKNHPNAWPVSTLTIGGITYTKAQLLQVLNTATNGDAVLILADQLIAAELNILSGASHSGTTDATIANADSLLTGINLLSHNKVKTNTLLGSEMVADAAYLNNFNNGLVV